MYPHKPCSIQLLFPRVCGRIIDSKEAQTKERNVIVCLFTFSDRVGGRGGGGRGKTECFAKRATGYRLEPNISHPPFIRKLVGGQFKLTSHFVYTWTHIKVYIHYGGGIMIR